MLLAGALNLMRAMITGRYAIRPSADKSRLMSRLTDPSVKLLYGRPCRRPRSALPSGCNQISLGAALGARQLLDLGHSAVNAALQRLLLSRQQLVREYKPEEVSPDFPPNGTDNAGRHGPISK